jgi:hypothetical protein
MSLDGRMETRLQVAVPIYLLDGRKGAQPPELALTENVSSSGVRVVTKWRREPGERERVTLLGGDTPLSAKVVYCHPVPQNSYCVGLKLEEHRAGWWNSEAVPAPMSVTGLMSGAAQSGPSAGNRGRR